MGKDTKDTLPRRHLLSDNTEANNINDKSHVQAIPQA